MELKFVFPSIIAFVLAIESFSIVSGLETACLCPQAFEQVFLYDLLGLTLNVFEHSGHTFSTRTTLEDKVLETFALVSALLRREEKDLLHFELQNLPLP